MASKQPQREIEYVHTDTIEYPNAIVRIFRPILTEEERAFRMRNIERAWTNLVKAGLEAEENKKERLNENG